MKLVFARPLGAELSTLKEFANITVIGRDKTGVVARVTNFLFEQHANIEALEEQVTRGQFSMSLQASWARGLASRATLASGLERLARELGMDIKARWSEPHRRQRMGIMVTGEEHAALALLQAVRSGRIKAGPAVMLSNWGDLEPLAKRFKIPFACVEWHDRAVAEKRALQLLEEYKVDFVVLARFMKILSPDFVWRYKNKIINIHPSLLPSFPGPQAYRQAYEHGVKIIGVTSHFVSMRLDEGPIIAQASASIPANAGLKEIVAIGRKLESAVLVKAVKLYLSRQLDVHWAMVKEV